MKQRSTNVFLSFLNMVSPLIFLCEAKHCYAENIRLRVVKVRFFSDGSLPANTRRLPNAGLMLGHRLRRWPNIKPEFGDRLVFSGLAPWPAGGIIDQLLLVAGFPPLEDICNSSKRNKRFTTLDSTGMPDWLHFYYPAITVRSSNVLLNLCRIWWYNSRPPLSQRLVPTA